MFEPPKGFNKNAKLAVAFFINKLSTFEDHDQCYVRIGNKVYRGGCYISENKTIRFEENTYKHYKGYVSGARIDMIQTLAEHRQAIRDFGVDDDGDVYWAVEFKINDFAKILSK